MVYLPYITDFVFFQMFERNRIAHCFTRFFKLNMIDRIGNDVIAVPVYTTNTYPGQVWQLICRGFFSQFVVIGQKTRLSKNTI